MTSKAEVSDDEYLQILLLLGLFQALEALIKVYIGMCYTVINIKVKDTVTFDYAFQDIENHSLEKLLTIFKKLNNNKNLYTRLNALRVARNQIAHKSILLASPSLSENLKMTFLGASDNQIDYKKMQSELNSCIAVLIEESKKVRSAI